MVVYYQERRVVMLRRMMGNAAIMRRRHQGRCRHPAGDWSRTPSDDDDHMPAHSPTGPRPDFVSAMPRLFFKDNSVSVALRVDIVNASPCMNASLCDTWKIKTRLHQMHLL